MGLRSGAVGSRDAVKRRQLHCTVSAGNAWNGFNAYVSCHERRVEVNRRELSSHIREHFESKLFVQSGAALPEVVIGMVHFQSMDSLPKELDRAVSLALLHEYTRNESLVKHALAVEACMRAYARKLDAAHEEAWGLVGLLHDFDYDQFPTREEHPFVGEKILEDRGYPPFFRRAILSHADYSNVTRETPLEKALFACDELAGFLTAFLR